MRYGAIHASSAGREANALSIVLFTIARYGKKHYIALTMLPSQIHSLFSYRSLPAGLLLRSAFLLRLAR